MKYFSLLVSSLLFNMLCFSQSKTSKPNILFILADDLGWGELGCYGNTFNETPNLDKLAKQGMKFKQAYAAAPICSPTRASLMTGQYPARVHITDFLPAKTERFLDPAKYVTINEALKTVGYHSGIIGKWHLDTDFENNKGGPDKHGFDEVIGSETKYIADGDYFYPYDKNATLKDAEPNEYMTDRQSKEALNFIDRNKSNPFYLYLAYYSVHTKLDAPDDLVTKYKNKFDVKYGAGEAEKIFGEKNKRHEAPHKDNPYLAAMLERIDAGVGAIMAKLETEGLAKNTLLIFFSDNGGAPGVADNGHLRAYKSWLYEGGIRDNLIMRWPGKIKPDTQTEVPVISVDFYPTFLDVAGAKQPANQIVDGKTILPLMTSGIALKRDVMFWHYPSETGQWKEKMSSAVRKGDYKLIEFYEDKRLELYDLKTDEEEKENLAKKNPEKLKELKKLLDDWRKEVNAEIPQLDKPAKIEN